MTSAGAIVDNTDPDVKYQPAGAWRGAGSNNEFNDTTSGCSTKGCTATFVFQGTGVAVFGTIESNNPFPVSTYSIDNSDPVPFTAQPPSVAYHQKLYSSPTLQDGTHTLVVTLVNDLGSTSTFWLDYFLIQPSPQTLPIVNTIVDDQQFTYSGTWLAGGVQQEYNSTTHGTNVAGSTAMFTFNGTQVAIYGTIDAPPAGAGTAVSSFVIDNGPPVTYNATNTTVATYENKFFDSGTLSPGVHTVTMTAVGNNTGTFWLDYALFRALAGPASPSTFSASSLITSSPSASLIPPPISPSPNAAQPSASKAKSSNHPAVIYGSVIGAVFVALVLTAIIALLRRHRRRKYSSSSSPNYAGEGMTESFVVTPYPPGGSSPSHMAGQHATAENPFA